MPEAQTPPRTFIRKYETSDKEAIVDICKDVYGGRDYIPRVIDEYKSDTDVLVEAASASDKPRALLCGAQDGSLYHIWGARTHPKERGKGIMRRMMRYVEARVENSGGTLISTTIQSNTGMLRLFQSEGYEQHDNEIWLWPDSSVMGDKDFTMSSVLRYHASKRCGSLSPCSSVEDLRAALRRVRAARHDDWIPASYEVVATDGRVLQDAIAKGNVFTSHDLNAVVAIVDDQLGDAVLSIVCASSCVGKLIGRIDVRGRPIKRMYVDMCGTDVSSTDFVHEKGWTSYLVLTKRYLRASI